ncbi:hypothetical protein D1007_05436 [Hordeum vulgare]|nr:hypothetical protein D1007_05436 [Hordeum vulgare]
MAMHDLLQALLPMELAIDASPPQIWVGSPGSDATLTLPDFGPLDLRLPVNLRVQPLPRPPSVSAVASRTKQTRLNNSFFVGQLVDVLAHYHGGAAPELAMAMHDLLQALLPMELAIDASPPQIRVGSTGSDATLTLPNFGPLDLRLPVSLRVQPPPRLPSDKIFEKVINPYLTGVLQHPQSIEMREGMLHIRDVEGPKKTGIMETRLEAMEQQVFKCQGMVELGHNANHMMITEFTNKHRIDANDIGKHLSRLYERIDQLQAQIYDLQNQNCEYEYRFKSIRLVQI